jgi:gamma-glutamyltranspeptidase
VPGLVSGWVEAHRAHGVRALGEVLGPAIDLAEHGFPVSQRLAQGIAQEPALAEFPSSRAIFIHDGRPLETGEILVQRDLADSLRALAEGGADAFYRGQVARAILRCGETYGGLFDPDDLASFQATWQDAIATTYRGNVVYEAPPNSSGHVLLEMLNLVERHDLAHLDPLGADSIHLMVEAKKLAFADREAYLADPAFVEVPIDGLISKEFADERARLIDPERAANRVAAGHPWSSDQRGARHKSHGGKPSDTTCFAVADQWGNVVCQLQSIQSSFGSGLVAAGTGILLNNRMTYWHLDPDHVDCLVPGKRVRHTMNPVMVARNGEVILAHGTPGADTQVQTNLQVLTHVLDHGYNVVEAVEAPRWRHLQDGTESTVPHACADELLLEARFAERVVDDLRRRGHPVRVIGPWEATGSEVMIQLDPVTGAKFGAADPRRDGYAISW